MEFIQSNLKDIILAITATVTAASALAALTPTPKDDFAVGKLKGILRVVYKIMDVLALNIGKAKEK